MSQGAPAGRNGSAAETEADSQAARETDQTRSDADQTLSDADQSTSDTEQHDAEVDQASSRSDQALADSDQEASDRDQQAADDALADGPADAEQIREYNATKAQRKLVSVERTATAVLRGQTAAERLDAAEHREEASRLRDLVADARDRAAEERDRQAALAAPTGPAAEARARAAADRARAARDRARAAADREQAAIDRQLVRAALADAHLDELTGTFQRGRGTRTQAGARARPPLEWPAGARVRGRRRAQGSQTATATLPVTPCWSTCRDDPLSAASYDPVVRFGGDEFVCAICDLDLDGVRRRFEEIDRELARRREGASISVGLAELHSGDTLDDLTSRGDAALYAVKRHRRAQEPATA